MSKSVDFVGKTSGDSFERGIRDLIAWAKKEGTAAELDQSLAELAEHGLTGTDKSPLSS